MLGWLKHKPESRLQREISRASDMQMTSLLSEMAKAPHSSTLAWKIPEMEEPGGLQFMWLLRVGHD